MPRSRKTFIAIASVAAWMLVAGAQASASSLLRTHLPAGVTFVDRIVATGYIRGARSWDVGENLVWGTGPLSTPQSLVTSWMNSPPHRENLLRARFREIGIAAVVGTPESSRDLTGVTVSSEYGFRSSAKAKKKRRGKRKAHKRHR